MNNQKILGMNAACEHAKQCTYGANMSISAALVVEMAERIAELEKERDVRDLEQQAKGVEDVVLEARFKLTGKFTGEYADNILHSVCDAFQGRAQELRNKAKALKEQGE